MDQFNGWEIQVFSDPKVINATSISTSGNIFLANTTGGISFELRNCVNGNGTGCCLTSSCAPIDGVGIADSSYSDTKFASGNGLLFNVTFQVVGTGKYSPILVENDQISSGGSSFVQHTTTSGSYGIAKDFTMSANPNSLDVFNGSSTESDITLTSYNFSGTVNLQASQPADLTVTLSLDPVQLVANGTALTKLVIYASNIALATQYIITITATSPSLPANSYPHNLKVPVTVHPKPDFLVYATPSLLLTSQSSSNSTIITVKSLNDFAGIVNLTVTASTSNAPFTLDKSSLNVPGGGSANATMSVVTQSSPLRFYNYYSVNASSISLFHYYFQLIEVTPPLGDFNVSANVASVTIQAGNTESFIIGVTGRDYFIGTVYILGNARTGLGLSFDPGTLFMNGSQTEYVQLKVATLTTTAPGTYTVFLTAYGQLITGQLTAQVGQGLKQRQHSLNVTLVVSAAPPPVLQASTFLGLQEPEFFGIVGGLALVLALLGVFEARRSGRPKSRPILED